MLPIPITISLVLSQGNGETVRASIKVSPFTSAASIAYSLISLYPNWLNESQMPYLTKKIEDKMKLALEYSTDSTKDSDISIEIDDSTYMTSAQWLQRLKETKSKPIQSIPLFHSKFAFYAKEGGKPFDCVLNKQAKYSAELQAIEITKKNTLEITRNNHVKELEQILAPQVFKKLSLNQPNSLYFYLNNTLNPNFAIHCQDLDLIHATFQSQVEDIRKRQKREFTKFVIELDPNSLPVDEQKIVSDIVTPNVQGPIVSTTEETSSNHHIEYVNAEQATGRSTPTQQSEKITSPEEEIQRNNPSNKIDPKTASMIKDLTDMGFSSEQAQCALYLSKSKLLKDQAIVLLLESSDKIEVGIKNGFHLKYIEQFTRKSGTSESFSTVGKSPVVKANLLNNTTQSWNQSSGSASNSLKSFGSWFDKAKAQVSTQIEEAKAQFEQMRQDSSPDKITAEVKRSTSQSTQASNLKKPVVRKRNRRKSLCKDLIESFTITLGSQVKYTKNLRIMVSDMSWLFEFPETNHHVENINMDAEILENMEKLERNAILAQTSVTLYSTRLNAVVLLVTPEDMQYFGAPNSSTSSNTYSRIPGSTSKRTLRGNELLFRQCKKTTEFHFDDIDIQIRNSIKQAGFQDGKANFQEGEFIVTRHSNLPLCHVVFHLIVDPKTFRMELNQRNPALIGLRNILRICSQFHIQQISIPLLFMPDDLSNIPAENKLNPQGENNSNNLNSNNASNFATSFKKTLSSQNLQLKGSETGVTKEVHLTEAFWLRRAETVLKFTRSFMLDSSSSLSTATSSSVAPAPSVANASISPTTVTSGGTWSLMEDGLIGSSDGGRGGRGWKGEGSVIFVLPVWCSDLEAGGGSMWEKAKGLLKSVYRAI